MKESHIAFYSVCAATVLIAGLFYTIPGLVDVFYVGAGMGAIIYTYYCFKEAWQLKLLNREWKEAGTEEKQ